jgi:hypothetical protein
VTVELLDLDDATALKTAMLPKGDGKQPLVFDFRSDVRVEPNTAREKQLYDALRTADRQDSDIVFFVFGAGKAGADRKEIGEASLNLEALLAAKRDSRDASLSVVSMDGKKTIGTMVVSVEALGTLERVKALRAPPTGSASVAARDDAIIVHVNQLALEPRLAQDRTVENVAIEIEFLDLDDATSLKTETLPKGDGQKALVFGFRSEVRVEPNTARDKSLRAVLRSTNSEDADVVFFVFASAKGGANRRQIGEASVNLKRMREAKRDERDVSLDVVGAAGGAAKIGTLSVSVFALATLMRVSP